MGLTPSQLRAVNEKGNNIIVSAGAGSGKTTVLKTRVLRILTEQKVSVNNLLILTFTNNAALEMKERIRKIILENEEVKKESELLDSAYITTFDSYAGSMVRKYSHLINMRKDFKIIDDGLIKMKIDSFLDSIFESLYKEREPNFLNLIQSLTVKNDTEIKNSIKDIYASICSLPNKDEFLNTYIDKFYSDEYVNKSFDEYENNVFKLHSQIVILLDKLDEETIKEEAYTHNLEITSRFRNSLSYDELRENIFDRLDASKNAYSEEAKDIKKEITAKKTELKKKLIDDKKTIIKHYLSTKQWAQVIINILYSLDELVKAYKKEINAYEFNDIALLAINLVKNYPEARDEIKNNTFEIMIDEYQDTSDIQEEFISYIQNNNVYMVGDVKQSIYRFRNANPYIFKNKYDLYKDGVYGIRIDLKQNFRSRKEVVEGINSLFNKIMFDEIGGSNYEKEHEMEFGNTTYNDYEQNESYKTEIYEYNKDNLELSDLETEAFIIADDIIKRINNHERVINFGENPLTREITYKDFAILVDKSKNFELLKKVLESRNIPTVIYKDSNIKDDDEIYILKSLINLIILIHNKDYKKEFKHYYLSVARSYLINEDDNKLLTIFDNFKYQETFLYQKCRDLSKLIDGISLKELIQKIIIEFNFFEKIETVYSVKEREAKLEYFLTKSDNLNEIGLNIYQINEYFDTILNSDSKISMSLNMGGNNSVKIMTIHKSKGLEFNYVYLPYLGSNFLKTPHESLFKFSTKYGMVLPFYDNGIGENYTLDLLKNDNNKEELSERIRLFYVALTRPKEKLIMLVGKSEKDKIITNLEDSTSYKDLLNYAKLTKFYKKVDLNEVIINKDYNLIKEFNFKKYIEPTTEILETKPLNIKREDVSSKHFSHDIKTLIDKTTQSELDFGTYMHYVFEVTDFKNPDYEGLKEKETKVLKNFLNQDIMKNINNAKIYKEKEIFYEDENDSYHGFIDLLIEYDGYFDIVDYKLSDIEDKSYVQQLKGYKNYIEKMYQKPVNIYLYSILTNTIKKL